MAIPKPPLSHKSSKLKYQLQIYVPSTKFEKTTKPHIYQKRIDDTAKKKWLLERRNKRTLKERINWIEEWIYKNKDKIHDTHITDRIY